MDGERTKVRMTPLCPPFDAEHRIFTYNHEDESLSPTADSVHEWLDLRLREEWRVSTA